MKNTKYTKNPSLFLTLATCTLGFVTISSNVQAQATSLVGYCWSKNAQNARGSKGNIAAAFRRGSAKGIRTHSASQTLARPKLRALNLFPNFNDKLGDLRKHYDDIRLRRVGRTDTGKTQLKWEQDLKLDLVQFATTGGGANGWGGGFWSSIRNSREDKNTSVHEIGHCYSATHGKGNRLAKTSQNQLPGNRYTSMLSGGKSDSVLIERFSNPNVKYKGARTGSNSKNNVAAINGRRFAIANRR